MAEKKTTAKKAAEVKEEVKAAGAKAEKAVKTAAVKTKAAADGQKAFCNSLKLTALK